MEIKDLSKPFTEKNMNISFLTLQNYILKKQSNNQKFFIGRLSGNETRLTGLVINNKKIENNLISNMLNVAGILFKNNKDIIEYAIEYNSSVKNSNVLGIWDCGMYTQAIDYYNYLFKQSDEINNIYICSHALEPYYYMNLDNYKFNEIFKNKKILIITSHKETTQMQIKKHNKLFKKQIFDDSTEFYIYKPAQQNGGNNDNNSWSYHMNVMKNEISDIKKEFNFDIALVSAGGFGMILSNFIYSELNTSVMYIGGALQLFFGILGNRWLKSENIIKHVNSEWIRPLDSDKPKNIKLCEGGCYW